MKKTLLVVGFLIMSTTASAKPIVTILNDAKHVLSTKAIALPLTDKGLQEAKEIDAALRDTLIALMPAAGLAAPQIGISKRIFIYSWDRSPHTLETAINPSFKPLSDTIVTKWEACFSAMPNEGPVEIALIGRYEKILATYTDLEGKKVQKILEGFGAKVFQHEYDHLEGTVNTRKQGVAQVKHFPSRKEFAEFIDEVKKQDKTHYIEPVIVE